MPQRLAAIVNVLQNRLGAYFEDTMLHSDDAAVDLDSADLLK